MPLFVSIFDLRLGLFRLQRIELLLVIFIGYGQHGVLGRGRSAVELLLHRLVQALAMLDHLDLPVVEHVDSGLFDCEFVDEEHLVVLLLTVLPL